MASYITRKSVLTGQTMYYAGNDHWTDIFEDRKLYDTELEATIQTQPTPGRFMEIENGNGSFKHASVINE